MIKYLGMLLCLLITACNIKTYTLKDGIYKVPIDTSVFSNKSKFNKSLLDQIDTSAVYEEYDLESKSLKRLNYQGQIIIYEVYRFYSNGCLNLFMCYGDQTLTKEMLDPNSSGYRGVFFIDKGRIRYDLFVPIDEFRNIGKISGTMRLRGDTMYLKRDDRNTRFNEKVFIKRKLPPEFLQYKADW